MFVTKTIISKPNGCFIDRIKLKEIIYMIVILCMIDSPLAFLLSYLDYMVFINFTTCYGNNTRLDNHQRTIIAYNHIVDRYSNKCDLGQIQYKTSSWIVEQPSTS